MTERNFMQLLKTKWAEGKFVCVGLDSDLVNVSQIFGYGDRAASLMFLFNQNIVEETHDLVCAYKPNLGFYLSQGPDGYDALIETIGFIHTEHPNIPVILDAKFGDVGPTSEQYAKAAFDVCHADAVTINPYLGKTAVQPFLDRTDKGIIVLDRTSNKGADEFQDLATIDPAIWKSVTDVPLDVWLARIQGDAKPLYQRVAEHVANHWNLAGNCNVVVGATYPAEAEIIRTIVNDNLPFLMPGVGKQGADVEAAVLASVDGKRQGMIVNSSSGIIFASKGQDYPDAARAATLRLHDQITAALNKTTAVTA